MTENVLHHTALDVAKWFLKRNSEEVFLNEADDISNMKLQKLLYYAQGTSLALNRQPLFDENILAWQHGPVVAEVYHVFSKYGRNGITFTDELKPCEEYSPEEVNVLEEVYAYFGQYSAWKLRNMTHEETPWRETPKNGIISRESICKYFEENYVDA